MEDRIARCCISAQSSEGFAFLLSWLRRLSRKFLESEVSMMPRSAEVRLHCRDNIQCRLEFCKIAEINAAFVSQDFRGNDV